jgi:N-acetylglucosamine-6-phosphate deacetylase
MTNGYIDLQVNGYAGVDFHRTDVTAEELNKACQRMRGDGTGRFLWTAITGPVDRICAAASNMVKLREKDPLVQEMIFGAHIEGPFISPIDGYRGAHPKAAVKEANVDDMKRILEAAGGLVKLVTLAPEQDPGFKVTSFLAKQGVRVAGGHSNATMNELNGAIDAGLSMWTHLGNGCPMQMHRHENVVQRVLSVADRIWPMFIADGAHVAFYALKNYLKLVGDRAIVVTDAVAPAGNGPGRYSMVGWDLVIGEDLVCRAPDGSHLVGSALPFNRAVQNLREKLGLSDERIKQLTIDNPKKVMGVS